MLYLNSFSNPVLGLLFTSAEFVLRPFLWCLNQFVSTFITVTPEQKHLWLLVLRILISPVYIFLLLILVIPAACAFIVRCLLHLVRRPYCLSVSGPGQKYQINNNRGEILFTDVPTSKFSVATSNLCLLPECLSRFNNLSETPARSKEIGERIVVDQFFYKNMTKTFAENESNKKMNGNSICKKDNMSENGLSFPVPDKRELMPPGNVITHFPHLDFLCIQEAWDRDYCRILIEQLHKVFPWILYDVGKTRLTSNFFMFNSGLLVASRYPVMDADFKVFKNSCNQCLFNSKGLFMVKVLVQKRDTGDLVGYIFNTHLQAYQGNYKIIDKQLDDIQKWTKQFQQQMTKEHESVIFDVLCGDFNFDNMSPALSSYPRDLDVGQGQTFRGDKDLWNHTIFEEYEDTCRLRPGQDKPWTIGTEMRQKYLWDSDIQSPEGLQHALSDPLVRQRYILDATVETTTISEICRSDPKVDKDGNYKFFTAGGKRRVDYILYRKSCPLELKGFNFVTRLATLTDHIPLSMTFSTDCLEAHNEQSSGD